MMRKQKHLFTVCFVILIIAFVYICISLYFHDRFLPNSWMGELYITGLTPQELDELLLKDEKEDVFTAYFGETAESIQLNAIDYQKSYSDELKQIALSQSGWDWPRAIFMKQEINIRPQITINEEKLNNCWNSLRSLRQRGDMEKLAVQEEENGFVLVDTRVVHFDSDACLEKAKESLYAGNNCFVYDDTYCLEIEDSDKDLAVKDYYDSLKRYLNREIRIDCGKDILSLKEDWLGLALVRENGLPYMNENQEFCYDRELFLGNLGYCLEAYNTYGKNLAFETSRGEILYLPCITYGSEFDVDEACDAVWEAFQASDEKLLEYALQYDKECYTTGLTDIGNTYVEVDMTNQKLYFYKGGIPMLVTDVVTGNEQKGMATPVGINFIYFMQHDRVLRGGGTPTPVHDWMAVYKGVGIHDAKWRKEFGGEIYQDNGSHGCINIPLEMANALYDMVEVGIPVLTYY